MENNANTIETILYPLSSGTENPTMLRIEIEYIPLEHLKSAWHYTLIDQFQESTGYSLSAAEAPPVTSRTAAGHTWLKTFAFLFSSDGTTGQFTKQEITTALVEALRQSGNLN